MTIKTSEDWWNLVNKHWIDLFSILDKFLDLSSYERLERREDEIFITNAIDNKKLASHIIMLKETKDPTLEDYFQEAWWKAPDESWIHTIPKWNILCDLCSESWVLNFKEENI